MQTIPEAEKIRIVSKIPKNSVIKYNDKTVSLSLDKNRDLIDHF